MQNLEPLAVVIGIAVGALSILTFVTGIFTFVWSASRKNYAAQRDMEHFKNNQRQTIEHINLFVREVDNNSRIIQTELSEIKSKIEFLMSSERGH